jgi:hypothetical protein
MPTTSYNEGHVKHNPATGEVALRTIFPTDQGAQLAGMAWLVATTNVGARSAKTEEVESDDWEDLYVPPAPEAPPTPPAPNLFPGS